MIKIKIELCFIGPKFSGKQKSKTETEIQEVIKQAIPALNRGQDNFVSKLQRIAKDGTIVIECREKEENDGTKSE